MPAVWYIGQAAKRTVGTEDWADFGITNRNAVTWEQENGWSIPHVQLTTAQIALLNNDPLFIVGAPDGPRTGMPAGVDATDTPTKGWVVEQVVQRLGERGSVADPDEDLGLGNPAADVPVGGFAGQVLTKISELDYDVQWKTPMAEADAAAIVRELTTPGTLSNSAVKQVAGAVVDESIGGIVGNFENSIDALEGAADPLAYLNSITVLCSWRTRDEGTTTFPQGMNINAEAGEIYVVNQDKTVMRIDVRNLDGTLKSSRTVSVVDGAFTEALPYWYNSSGDLMFFIRTSAGSNTQTSGHYTYNVYNYTQDTMGPIIPINGGIKADVDGPYLITSDIWTQTIGKIWIYDWESVKDGTPRLVNTIHVANPGPTVEKNQGMVLNGGYIFLLQGAQNTSPTITVYNVAGDLVNIFGVSARDFGIALNKAVPGAIANVNSFQYENEGGCKYKGKLATLEVVNSGTGMATSRSYVVIHNQPHGAHMPVTLRPSYTNDTGWVDLELINGAIPYGSDTIPRIRRIGKQVYMEGAIKGLTAANVDVAVIPEDFLPEFNRQYVQIFGSQGATASWQVHKGQQRLKVLGVSSGTVNTGSWFPLAHDWARP